MEILQIHEGDDDSLVLRDYPDVDIELTIELSAGGPDPRVDSWETPRLRARGKRPADLYVWGIGWLISERFQQTLARFVRKADGVRFLDVEVETSSGLKPYYCPYFEKFFDVIAPEKTRFLPDGRILQPAFDAAKVAGRRVFGLADTSNHRAFVDGEVGAALRSCRLVNVGLAPQPVWSGRSARR